MVLKSLYTKLNVSTKFQKTLVAAMVMSVLNANNYGITNENYEEVKKALLAEELSAFEFDVLYLAADSWGNDCEDLLSNELGSDTCIFKVIFQWLDENEVIPGIGKKVS